MIPVLKMLATPGRVLGRAALSRSYASSSSITSPSEPSPLPQPSPPQDPTTTPPPPKKEAAPKKTYLLGEFFDREENLAKTELRALDRPGRSWMVEELRLKSNTDLHKLWYVLLKERNMLLTMQEACVIRAKMFPNPERLDRVKESMDNLEAVVHERNDAFLRLETGEGASPPMRTITSFMGFTYQQQAKEHYEPAEVTQKKEYEVPLLDDRAYMMQRLWKERVHMKKGHDDFLEYWQTTRTKDQVRFRRGLRKKYDRPEHLPTTVMAARKAKEGQK